MDIDDEMIDDLAMDLGGESEIIDIIAQHIPIKPHQYIDVWYDDNSYGELVYHIEIRNVILESKEDVLGMLKEYANKFNVQPQDIMEYLL